MERDNNGLELNQNGFNEGIVGRIDLFPGREPVVDLTGKVHQLPCSIKHNGPSAVSQYFKSNNSGIEVEGGLSLEETYFRGRKLQGATIPLPPGYSGFVLGKKKTTNKRKSSGISEENSNCWEAVAGFQSITYWNHDILPSRDDTFMRSFHWFPVSNALHRPVSAEDLAATKSLSSPGTGIDG